MGSTPTGGIFKQECEVSAKLKLTPVTLVYQGLQEFFDFKIILLLIRFVHQLCITVRRVSSPYLHI